LCLPQNWVCDGMAGCCDGNADWHCNTTIVRFDFICDGIMFLILDPFFTIGVLERKFSVFKTASIISWSVMVLQTVLMCLMK
jgi:hypothetical protein